MLMERNTLMEWVYPKIKEYCKEKHGLEFQVSIEKKIDRLFMCDTQDFLDLMTIEKVKKCNQCIFTSI